MKYHIQIFVLTHEVSTVGSWHNTAWGGDDLNSVITRASKISQTSNYSPNSQRALIAKVRVMEQILDLNCVNNSNG